MSRNKRVNGCVFIGCPGSGKTYQMEERYKEINNVFSEEQMFRFECHEKSTIHTIFSMIKDRPSLKFVFIDEAHFLDTDINTWNLFIDYLIDKKIEMYLSSLDLWHDCSETLIESSIKYRVKYTQYLSCKCVFCNKEKARRAVKAGDLKIKKDLNKDIYLPSCSGCYDDVCKGVISKQKVADIQKVIYREDNRVSTRNYSHGEWLDFLKTSKGWNI